MDETTKIDKLNELLLIMDQQEILAAIRHTSNELMLGSSTKLVNEFVDIFDELDDYNNRIFVIQSLSNSLKPVKKTEEKTEDETDDPIPF